MPMKIAVQSLVNMLAGAELCRIGGSRHRIGAPFRCRRARPAASAIAASAFLLLCAVGLGQARREAAASGQALRQGQRAA